MTSRPPSVSRVHCARVLFSRNSIFEMKVACGQPNNPASICPTWFESSSTACLPMNTICGASFATNARRIRATAYGSSARASSIRIARSTPIARAARICSSAAVSAIVTPTISVASPRSRMRSASSIAISSNGLMTDLDSEFPEPAYGSETHLNATRIFIRQFRTLGFHSNGTNRRLDDIIARGARL